MTRKAQHVVPRGNQWAVRSTGSQRASGLYETQGEAISIARERARSKGTELFIHGEDGRIRARDSYGNDPMPPKG